MSEQPSSIVFVPYGGLCNRMNAIASAYELAELLDTHVHIVWKRKPWCNAAFEDLFNPICRARVTLQSLDRLPLRWQRSLPRNLRLAGHLRTLCGVRNLEDVYPQQTDIIGALSRADRAYISTCQRLVPTALLRELFIPLPALQERIAQVVSPFTSHTYGLHIRRGDHTYCIEHSPLEAFTARMDTIITTEPDASFYLATDDEGVKHTLRQRYPHRILSYEAATLNRSTVEGMQDALIDLYALSHTRRIFGSLSSSFSEVAAELGGIDAEF